jgi:hypothetical protein
MAGETTGLMLRTMAVGGGGCDDRNLVVEVVTGDARYPRINTWFEFHAIFFSMLGFAGRRGTFSARLALVV